MQQGQKLQVKWAPATSSPEKCQPQAFPTKEQGRINSQVAKHVSFKVMQPLLMKTQIMSPRKGQRIASRTGKAKWMGPTKFCLSEALERKQKQWYSSFCDSCGHTTYIRILMDERNLMVFLLKP